MSEDSTTKHVMLNFSNLSLKDLEQMEQDKLVEFRKMIQEDEELKDLVDSEDDEFLLMLLRARRYRTEVTLKLIKTTIEYKDVKYPELFEKARPSCIKHVLDEGVIRVVKREEGPTVIVFHTAKWKTSEISFDDLLMAGLQYALEVTISSVDVQRNGIVMLLDMNGFGFSHARQCSYSNVMKLANCIIFGAPFLIIGCSIINSPYVFEKVYQVVKFAIPERYRSYVTVTKTDLSHLHSLVKLNSLPLSLGGEVLEDQAWESNIEQAIVEHEAVLKLITKLEGEKKENLS